MRITVLGLSITSSWGNGHATTWRALLRALAERGHEITFLERDVPWYREQRDLPQACYCRILLYRDLDQLRQRYARSVAGERAFWRPSPQPSPTGASSGSPRLTLSIPPSPMSGPGRSTSRPR